MTGFLPLRILTTAVIVCVAVAASAEEPPVAKFATLKADKVNVRTGPGTRYPIDWVFLKKGLPVEITASHDVWRKIRDSEGAEGWVKQTMISDRRGMIVTGQVRTLRGEPKEGAPVVARLEPGVFGRIDRCAGEWCRTTVSGYQGWLKRREIWGVSANEEFD